MSQMPALKNGRLALAALVAAASMSCAGPPTPAEFTSVGRGAPVTPALPWEQWRDQADFDAGFRQSFADGSHDSDGGRDTRKVRATGWSARAR